jgi:prepilin-type N-terminal cleavage/methylation domain-containing protein
MHGEPGSAGFSVVEVLVAIVVIAIGLLALGGSSASVTRMLGTARPATRAAAAAERRLEELRREARSSTPPCAALAPGSAASGGISERWETVIGPGAAVLRVIVSWEGPRGIEADTLATAVQCG